MSNPNDKLKKTRYFVISLEGLSHLVRTAAEVAMETGNVPAQSEKFTNSDLFQLQKAGVIEGEILDFHVESDGDTDLGIDMHVPKEDELN